MEPSAGVSAARGKLTNSKHLKIGGDKGGECDSKDPKEQNSKRTPGSTKSPKLQIRQKIQGDFSAPVPLLTVAG